MNAGDSFFDTSVLMYLMSTQDAKTNRVEDLRAENGVVSVQVCFIR
jgi:predicted nucleic acid-binding protein